MRFKQRLWSFILPILTVVSFELILRWPWLVFLLAPVLLVMSFVAVRLLLGSNLKTPITRWRFWLSPAVFYLSSFGIFFLVGSGWMRHLLALLCAVLIGFYFESIFTYVWEHQWYEAYSLENISSYLNGLSAFFISSSFLGFTTLLQVPLWLMIPLPFLFYFVLAWQMFWVTKLEWVKTRAWVTVIALLIGELLFVLQFLPINFLLSGAIATVIWYTLISLSRSYLLGYWSRKLWTRYLVFNVILISVLLGGARWI